MKTVERSNERSSRERSSPLAAVAIAIITVATIIATASISRAQTATPTPTPAWPMFLDNPGHTGLSTASTANNFGGEKWNYSGSYTPVLPSVAIGADGTVYFADSALYAINFNGTPTVKWQFTNSGNFSDIQSSPAIGPDGTIYAGSFDKNLYAINPNGSLKWTFATGGDIESSPVVGSDGTIYVGSDDFNLYAINPAGSSACTGPGTPYACCTGPQAGTPAPNCGLKWAFSTGDEVQSSPAIDANGIIYFASNDGNLYALQDNGTSWAEQWAKSSYGAYGYSSPTVAPATVSAAGTIYYIGWNSSGLYAINPANGLANWEYDFSGSDSSPTIGADGTIYLGDFNGLLWALTDSGTQATEKWTFATNCAGQGECPVNSSAAISADGTIYFGAADDNLYAINPAGSSACTGPGAPYACCTGPQAGTPAPNCGLKWAFNAENSVESAPAIGGDGTVYFGAGSSLFALGPPPPTKITVAPGSLAFPSTPVGDTTVSKTLTIKNAGKTNLMYVGYATITSDPAEFAITSNSCPSTPALPPSPPGGVAAGSSCTITLAFTPVALGARSGSLSLYDNSATSPQQVALSGTGTVSMTVTPTSHAFGSLKDGSKAIKAIVVHNYQSQAVSLGESFNGPNAGDFNVTGGTCTSSLGMKSVCVLIVTFAPTAVGTESASMTVTDSPDPLGPYYVSFSTAATIPESVSPARELNFAKVVEGTPKTLSVTVTNNASASGASITLSASIGGANEGDFAVTGGTCGGTLGPSSSCTYAVTFTPSTETAESGTLTIGVAQDPNGGPAPISLSGTGDAPPK